MIALHNNSACTCMYMASIYILRHVLYICEDVHVYTCMLYVYK